MHPRRGNSVATVSVPGPIAGAGLPRPDLGWRWPSRLVATAAEDRVSFRRNLRRFVTASDCQTIATYDLAGFSVSWAGLGRVLVNHICKAKLTKYCCNI